MDSPSSLFTNERAKSNSDNTAINMNDQQSSVLLSFNAESPLSLTTNSALSSLSISELIDFHKNRFRKGIIFIILGSMGLIGLGFMIRLFNLPKCDRAIKICPTKKIVFLVLGSAFLGMSVFLALSVWCCGFRSRKKQFQDLNDTENEPVIWRLDGEEWIRYLNYIYGPDREWTESDPLSSFCCRRSTYDRVMDHQYGQIVFYGNGLIIDELYFISFRTYSLQGIQLLTVGEYQQTLGLRIHTYIKAGKNSRNIYFDVFAPSGVSMEQLQTIAQSYNGKISGPDGLHMAMTGLYPAATVLQTLR